MKLKKELINNEVQVLKTRREKHGKVKRKTEKKKLKREKEMKKQETKRKR